MSQVFDLMQSLSCLAGFYLFWEWVLTTCIWSIHKRTLSADEVQGIENVCFPRRWLCRVLMPPDFTVEYERRKQQAETKSE